MKKIFSSLIVSLLFASAGFAQVKKSKPASGPAVPIKSIPNKSDPKSNGKKYVNAELKFEITFPDPWVIADDDFTRKINEQGLDLALKAPEDLSKVSKVQINRALDRVTVLVTAYRPTFTTEGSSLIRVSSEDLSFVPAVRDAVDYFDLMRSQFKAMNLPPDFTYSETQAEQLGPKQFAYLDTSTKAGKKRLYATVRNGHAILFSLSYNTDNDLQTMRQVLSQGNFALK